jgi:hypothetical protein
VICSLFALGNLLGRSLIVEDRELITGQDPMAARELGIKLRAKIEKYLEKK